MSDFKITRVPLDGVPMNLVKVEFYIAATVTEETIRQELYHSLDDFGSTFRALIFHELDFKEFKDGHWVDCNPDLIQGPTIADPVRGEA